MTQLRLPDAEHAGKRKQTRREVFLAEMESVVAWPGLLSQIEPHYPKAGRGRHPYALETMLRIHFLQQWYALSDPAMEEALYEIASMRQFARLSLLEAIPDKTTILNFRRLLERPGSAWLGHSNDRTQQGYTGANTRPRSCEVERQEPRAAR